MRLILALAILLLPGTAGAQNCNRDSLATHCYSGNQGVHIQRDGTVYYDAPPSWEQPLPLGQRWIRRQKPCVILRDFQRIPC